ncbi:gastric triacylglycerol lipase-like [Rhipicephalus sanguineus]|uniref:gastric triacylglycerol lipase-like n=1 Tax=Rhipicephalus sanguineus TaxID=34632 RepID=UPI0020C1E731|nr:gastric triacylglycerol lipase-like [Rhipicephalus sanguineus]
MFAQLPGDLGRIPIFREEDFYGTGLRCLEELIQVRGYPVESREVVTEDGYVLGIYRIPRGRLETEETTTGSPYLDCDGASRPPLLLVHGLLGSAVTWVTNYADQSLGYVLADAGYDVWLGNLRGSTLARKHVKLNPDSNISFWDFTFDQMIEYDVPAMIDYVLRETGNSRLGYIGHSQGTLIMFGLLSSVPAYNDKVGLFVALAPVATPVHAIFIARQQLLALSERPSKPLWKKIADKPCRMQESLYLCESVWSTIFGPSVMFNVLVKTGRFCKYDYGAAKNKEIYRQTAPPCYPLEEIRAPVAIFWGHGDTLSRPQDVDRIRNRISSIVVDERVGSGPFNHVDFIYGVHVKRVLYDRMIQVIGQFYSTCLTRSTSESTTATPHENAKS